MTPTRWEPASHSVLMSFLSLMRYEGVPMTVDTSTSRFALELLAAPMTSRTSTSPATVLAEAWRFCVA